MPRSYQLGQCTAGPRGCARLPTVVESYTFVICCKQNSLPVFFDQTGSASKPEKCCSNVFCGCISEVDFIGMTEVESYWILKAKVVCNACR